MAIIRCRHCGAKLIPGEGYEVNEGGVRKFFCSKEEYETYNADKNAVYTKIEEQKNAEAKTTEALLNELSIITGEIEVIVNSDLNAERKTWNDIADDKVLIDYLTENEPRLTAAITRLGVGQPQRVKIRYLSAIIRNELGEYSLRLKEVKMRQEQFRNSLSDMNKEEFIFHTNNKCRTSRRKGFSELDSESEEEKSGK